MKSNERIGNHVEVNLKKNQYVLEETKVHLNSCWKILLHLLLYGLARAGLIHIETD